MADADKKSWLERYRLRIDLLMGVLVGVLGIGTFGPGGTLPLQFLEHLFMAIAVAGFIALFVELTFHQQVARNVFEAAIGYFLPEELTGELRWIYARPFLCEEHTQTVHIECIENESLVKLKCEVTRVFRNITGEVQPFLPSLSVEENLHTNRPTKIINYQYQLEGEPKSENFSERIEPDVIGVAVRLKVIPAVNVQSKAVIRAFFEYEKTLRENDFDYMHFGAPTKDGTVILYVPEKFMASVIFSHRDNDPTVVKTGPHIWKLNGVLLPLQGIRIVWNLKDAYETWRASFTPQA